MKPFSCFLDKQNVYSINYYIGKRSHLKKNFFLEIFFNETFVYKIFKDKSLYLIPRKSGFIWSRFPFVFFWGKLRLFEELDIIGIYLIIVTTFIQKIFWWNFLLKFNRQKFIFNLTFKETTSAEAIFRFCFMFFCINKAFIP